METGIVGAIDSSHWVYVVVVLVAAIVVTRQYLRTRQRASLLLSAGLVVLAIGQLVSTVYDFLYPSIVDLRSAESVARSVFHSNVVLLSTTILGILGMVLMAGGALLVGRR